MRKLKMANTSKLKYYTSLLLTLLLATVISCRSDLSKEKINDLSLIKAEIEIVQNPFNKTGNSTVVTLRDKDGYRISNDSILIYVNDVEREISHRQGLYYNEESCYIFSDVPAIEKYKVDIKLSDNKKYFLGEVNALGEEKEENIVCNDEGDFNNDFTIKWHNLKDIDELSVMTSALLKTSTDKERNYSYRDEIIKKIGATGSFTIPRTTYTDAESTISSLEFKFRTLKAGTMNPKLVRNSKITISTSIEKNVNFEEQ